MTDLRLCDLRLGDFITARVRGVFVCGTVVEIGAYAWIAGSGFSWDPGRGLVPDPEGHLPVAVHGELESVIPPTDPADYDVWMDAQLIPCSRRHAS